MHRDGMPIRIFALDMREWLAGKKRSFAGSGSLYEIFLRRCNIMIKIDVLKHMLVPEHTILDEDEVERVLERFSVKRECLPKILITDPAIKIIGGKEGEIVKIIRTSLTTGRSEYYRFIVAK